MNHTRSPFAPFPRTQVDFPWQDLTTALVKQAGLHEGLWKVGFSFGLQAMNININKQHLPAALSFIEKVVLTRVEKIDPLVVDAAVVNPKKRIVLASALSPN